jgi:4'-phosphopantetheinyl transferase
MDPKVWAVNLDCASGDLSLLSTSERARAGRLKRPQDRKRSLEAYCAIRRITALQLGVEPRCLEFDTTIVGKLFLTRPVQNLEFNLSHSGCHGLIAMAIDRSVGVDIEIRRLIRDMLGVALQIATPREAKRLKQLPTSQVHSTFFDLWSRKEAVLKSLGRGFFYRSPRGGGWIRAGSQLRKFRQADLDGRDPCHRLERDSSSGDRGQI